VWLATIVLLVETERFTDLDIAKFAYGGSILGTSIKNV